MAFGGLGGIIGATGGMISNAIKNNNKNKGNSSGGSHSGGSSHSGGGSSSGSTGSGKTPAVGGGSSANKPAGGTGGGYTGKTIEDYQKAWQDAQKRGDAGGMAEAHAGAEALRKQQGYSGGADGSLRIPTSGGAGLISGIAGGMGNAVNGILGNKGSSGSSTVSKPGGSYTYTDSNGNLRPTTDNTDYAALYQQYFNAGDYDAAQRVLDSRYLKLGQSGKEDSWQGMAQSQLDAYRAQQIAQQEKEALRQTMEQYGQMSGAIRDEIGAQVEQNIAALNAQKPLVQQAGAQANAAAQQGYYNAIDPNGMGAEQRAALGLSDSGLTESAQIAASNAYQGAVNSNAQNVQNQLAQIDLAIQNAKLSGDIATAQQLQSYYNTVLQAGMQAANQIANSNRWALENRQNGYQQNVQNGFTQAGITGKYNGQLTLEGQRAMREFEGMDLENKMNALNLAAQQTYGMKSAEADYLIKMAQAAGQDLNNLYLQMQIDYAKKQF